MRFRIGVHLGDVIEKPDGTIYGDGVNLAARLQGLANPGGVAVSESVRVAVKGKVQSGFEDLGQQAVKNIAEPIHAYRLNPLSELPSAKEPCAPDSGVDLSLPDRPSVAVLAFVNLSGDPEQEYFTDGITEDIITELSRFQSLFVIARNSSFTYKGKSVDIKEVGRQLGVRYILEGSIRRVGDRIRVTAELIDASTRGHLWAERYDRILEDVFEVQEDITASVVSTVAPRIDAAESLRVRQRPGNLNAYELAVRAWSIAWQAFQRTDAALRDEAIRHARAALSIDTESVQALNAIAFAQWQHLAFGTAVDPANNWGEGMDAAVRATELSDHATSHICKAFLLVFAPTGGQWSEALIEAKTAYQLNPQDAFSVSGCGWVMAVAGDAGEGIRRLERAVRLNPRDPLAYATYSSLALANLITRDYRKGLEWVALAKNMAPTYVLAHIYAASLHVGAAEYDLATAALDEAKRLAPAYVQSRLDGHSSLANSEYRPRLLTFLRIAAGLEDRTRADSLR
jgi:adenylate cyclase